MTSFKDADYPVRQIVDNVLSVLERERLKYWLDYGTLLGVVRTRSFIPHDEDADIGMYAADADKVFKILKTKLKPYGYSVRKAFKGSGLQVYLTKSRPEHMDIFFWERNDKGMMYRKYYIEGTDDNKGKDFPQKWLEPFVYLGLEGRPCTVPKEFLQLVSYRYGETWQQELSVSDFNVTKNVHKDMFNE